MMSANRNQEERRPARNCIRASLKRARGAAIAEFAVAGPVVLLLGLAVLQHALLFNAKNMFNHATFMAGRAGSFQNADLTAIRKAYARALLPHYGGGLSESELQEALTKATADVEQSVRIELLNPTKESFDDWASEAAKAKHNTDRRVIPNDWQGNKGRKNPKPNSGQTIHEANMLKLRIVHGYEPKIPLMGTIYRVYQQWLDKGDNAFHTQMIEAGRIPVVSYVTLHMQSDPFEPEDPVSSPGQGNNGNPQDPGDPPPSDKPPPECVTIGCSVLAGDLGGGGGSAGGEKSGGGGEGNGNDGNGNEGENGDGACVVVTDAENDTPVITLPWEDLQTIMENWV